MEWVSPVVTTRINKPARSAKAKYLPSGEIAALMMGSSCAFEVSLRSRIDTLGLTRRARTHPPPVPITRTANTAAAICQLRRGGSATASHALATDTVLLG